MCTCITQNIAPYCAQTLYFCLNGGKNNIYFDFLPEFVSGSLFSVLGFVRTVSRLSSAADAQMARITINREQRTENREHYDESIDQLEIIEPQRAGCRSFRFAHFERNAVVVIGWKSDERIVEPHVNLVPVG